MSDKREKRYDPQTGKGMRAQNPPAAAATNPTDPKCSCDIVTMRLNGEQHENGCPYPLKPDRYKRQDAIATLKTPDGQEHVVTDGRKCSCAAQTGKGHIDGCRYAPPTEAQAPREFWIDDWAKAYTSISELWKDTKHGPIIHVIEYSAHETICRRHKEQTQTFVEANEKSEAKIADLEQKLSGHEETVIKLANRNADLERQLGKSREMLAVEYKAKRGIERQLAEAKEDFKNIEEQWRIKCDILQANPVNPLIADDCRQLRKELAEVKAENERLKNSNQDFRVYLNDAKNDVLIERTRSAKLVEALAASINKSKD